MNKQLWARFYALSLLISLSFQASAIAEPIAVSQPPAAITSLELINLLQTGLPAEVKPELTPEQIKEEEEKVTLEIPKLSPRQTLDVYSTIYKNEKVSSVTTAFSASMRDIVRDLELFYSQGQEGLLRAFDRTSTVTGRIELARMLTHPESDMQVLSDRQAFIKELVENPKLFNKVESLVSTFDESTFLSLWQKQNKPTQDVINAVYPLSYFANWSAVKALHKNTAFLESQVRLGNVATSCALLSYPVLLPITGLALGRTVGISNGKRAQEYYKNSIEFAQKDTFYSEERRLERIQDFQDSLARSEKELTSYYPDKNAFSGPLYMYKDGVKKIITLVADGSVKQGMKFIYEQYKKDTNPGKHWLALGIAAYLTAYVGSYLWICKNAVNTATQTKDSINHVQTKLISAADLVNSLKTAYQLGKKDKTFAQGFASYKQLSNFFEHQTDLVQRLQSNTFKGQASFFSISGRVLSTYTVMKDAKDELIPAVKMLGQLDACLSIAKLIKESQHDRVGYCFVDYVHDTKPCLHIHNFWNPMVAKDVVVTNSVEFGGNQARRAMIVTGSNTGGKSTCLKGITISVLLAHTLGIASAQSMAVTPFSYIGSSMNIADNTFTGDSLYKAEVKRAHSIINTLGSLGDKFGYVVIDELFRGTSPDQAEQGTFKCVNRLMENSNAVCIFATHFKQNIKELAAQSQGTWENYKVDVIKNDDGSITRPFKLEPGIGNVDVAMTILDDGF